MRITRLATITLLAAIAASCRDAAPTSPSAPELPLTARVHNGGPASITIPAPNGFASTVLARGNFLDAIDATFRIKADKATKVVHVNDPTQMVMARITIQPGGALPWHTHPGPALVTVVAGELTLVDGDDCAVRSYGVGAAFMDPGQGHVHVGLNAGNIEMALYVTYLDVPIGGSPLMIAATPPSC